MPLFCVAGSCRCFLPPPCARTAIHRRPELYSEAQASDRPPGPEPPRALTATRARETSAARALRRAARRAAARERKTTPEGDSRVVTLEKEDPFSSPQLKLEKSTGMEDMLQGAARDPGVRK